MVWILLGVTLQILALAADCEIYSTRIVGGSAATVEQFPFVAQMLLDTWDEGLFQQICAASILTARHLLSAAHCFQYNKDTGKNYSLPSFWKVRVGSAYRSYGGELFAVLKIINHPAFNRALYDNDISLVVLPTNLKFGATVRQATIPEPDSTIVDGAAIVLIGWGASVTAGQPSDQLMKATMRTVNQDQCQTRYSSIMAYISDAMMCAGLIDIGGVDGCHGDSGGPLIYSGVVVGIVSFGYACGHAHYPGVYTNISHFTSWIVHTVNTNSKLNGN